MIATQLYGIAERRDESLAVGAGANMTAKFGANIGGQLIIDVSRQLPENIQAAAFTMLMVVGRRRTVSRAS